MAFTETREECSLIPSGQWWKSWLSTRPCLTLPYEECWGPSLLPGGGRCPSWLTRGEIRSFFASSGDEHPVSLLGLWHHSDTGVGMLHGSKWKVEGLGSPGEGGNWAFPFNIHYFQKGLATGSSVMFAWSRVAVWPGYTFPGTLVLESRLLLGLLLSVCIWFSGLPASWALSLGYISQKTKNENKNKKPKGIHHCVLPWVWTTFFFQPFWVMYLFYI